MRGASHIAKYFKVSKLHNHDCATPPIMTAKTLEREEPNYFGAGPAKLPTSVLQQAAYDLLSYDGVNLGVGEISHRSKPAAQIINDTKAALTRLLNIPETHEVFFMQGGGTTGFLSIAYNLVANYAHRTGKKGKVAYAVTGSWSQKAAEELARLGFDTQVVVNTKPTKYTDIPDYSQWQPVDANTAYLYICDNETVNGNEFNLTPPALYLPEGVELVADMSSNILSKPIDVSRYGLIMAGAQKNIGLAGLTLYIIKKLLIAQPSDAQLNALNIALLPIAFHYPTVIKNNSAYNTIPIFTCHILKLVMQKLETEGGVEAVCATNATKAQLLYDALDAYPQVYVVPVVKEARSKMNVVFTLKHQEQEEKFIADAAARKLTGIKGHRSVGGMRASLYNAVLLESVKLLVEFVHEFAKTN